MVEEEQKIINTRKSSNALASAIDIKERADKAVADYPEFFEDPKHLRKVNKVYSIVEEFFPEHKGMYVTQRSNGGNPFTVIKVHRPKFPAVSIKKKNETYYDPLKKLGVTPIFSKGKNSYLYRVF